MSKLCPVMKFYAEKGELFSVVDQLPPFTRLMCSPERASNHFASIYNEVGEGIRYGIVGVKLA